MRYSFIVLVLLLALATGCSREQTNTETATMQTETSADINNTSDASIEVSSSDMDKTGADTENGLDQNQADAPDIEILDNDAIEELMQLADRFYFNFYFMPEGDGTVTNMDRVLFALSYIAQYEYQELKKDTTNFMIEIPKDHVDHVVSRFFGTTVESYQLVEAEGESEDDPEVEKPWSNILFNGKVYTVPMQKSTWDSECELALESAQINDESNISIIFNVVKDAESVKQFEAVFEQREGDMPVLIKYKELDAGGDTQPAEEQ